MKTGDLTSGPARLDKAWKKLLARWQATEPYWHDVVSRQFEAQFLTPLHPQIMTAIERMKTLSGVLGTAEQECEDHSE